jgi:hypothetical protein
MSGGTSVSFSFPRPREFVFFSRSSAISRWAVSMPYVMGSAEEVNVALMVTAILE